MSSEMKIQIPSDLIEDTIRAEMVRQIGAENRDKLIESVVYHAMTQKKDDYSRTPTYFQSAVNEMIREEACKIFREWLDGNRKSIATALFAYLNDNKQKHLKIFAENIANSIDKYGIDVSIRLDNKE